MGMQSISEIKVSYNSGNRNKVKVTSSKCAYDNFMACWNQNTLEFQEEFKIMLLNRTYQILGVYTVSKGGMSQTLVDLRHIFSVSLKCTASAIILAHNHPSGNLSPSEPDKSLTNRIVKAGKLLDITVLDHLIVVKNGYTSFANEGYM